MKWIRNSVCVLLSLMTYFTSAQELSNYIELRVKNDDAGEISNWLHSGDDLGETQSMRVSAGLLTKSDKYNFKLAIESTEYSTLNTSTIEARDILFKELNNFQLSIDNDKLKNKIAFLSLASGLYYIQANRITFGASGQKYYWHKWLVSRFYSNKNWDYKPSYTPDVYVPYLELKYGFRYELLKKTRIRFYTINQLESRLASKINFTGLGARTYFNFEWTNDTYKMKSMELELESYYLSNFIQYQTMYVQLGPKFNFKRMSFYLQLNKPIYKYLNNPYTKYDDMEWLFNYGLLYSFK